MPVRIFLLSNLNKCIMVFTLKLICRKCWHLESNFGGGVPVSLIPVTGKEEHLHPKIER